MRIAALTGMVLCTVLIASCQMADSALDSRRSIDVWSGVAPGSEDWTVDEQSGFRSITNVKTPTLTVFEPDPLRASGAAIVVCPGGGFSGLMIGKEGVAVAEWLAARGITAFVLKYRVRRSVADDLDASGDNLASRATVLNEARKLAAADAAQAMRVLRARSDEFGIDPGRIGMIGFSAGAMTTMSTVVSGDLAVMPNIAASIYGAMPGSSAPAGGPPVFLVHAKDDNLVPVEKTLAIASAWEQAGLSVDLHIYERGGHGFGAERQNEPTDQWLGAFEAWLASVGWLGSDKQNVGYARDALWHAFQDPPNAARPRVWWHWLNGNITQDGIKKDLEWMHRIGIGGLQNFDVNFAVPTVVDKRIPYMSDDWKQIYRDSVDLANQLGIEFGIAASPGWSETGGPWVPPEDGMKKLVWSEITVPGSVPFSGQLPLPPTTTGPYQDQLPAKELNPTPKPEDPVLYRDTLVLAVPVDSVDSLPLPKLSLQGETIVGADLLQDKRFGTGVEFPIATTEKPTIVTMEYAEPVAVRSAQVFIPDIADIYSGARVAAALEYESAAGGWEKVVDIRLSTVPSTVSFSAITASKFRLVVKPASAGLANSRGAAPGYDDSIMRAMIAKFFSNATMPINEITLSAEPRIDQSEVKAGFAVAQDYYQLSSNAVGADRGVSANSVVDLTDAMRADGSLDWTPPDGQWRILRFGWSLLGKTNHPAVAEATGLEVDKLDAAAVKRYVENYLDNYRDAVGADLLGPLGISALLTDSTEVGAFNWSPSLLAKFKQVRGYDPTPWLPTMTGVIIESREASDKFLYDFRRTISELHATEHYGTVAAVARENGLEVYGESLEGWRPSLGDDLDMRRFADYPMAAVWSYGREEGPNPLYLADMRGAASVAHVFGQNVAAAESMTSTRHPWYHTPADLRRVVDLEFLHGINRVVIHSSVHQPRDDLQPGLSLRHIGQFFNRHTAWAEMARPWMDYIARSSYLLQLGKFVADVAYFYGEEAPLGAQTWDGYFKNVPMRNGYDFVSPQTVLNTLSVDDGLLVSEGGARYELLFLGGTSDKMTLQMLERIAELVRLGATIVGEPPTASPALADDTERFQSLVNELWSESVLTRVGRGVIIRGDTPEVGLAVRNIAPDFDYVGRHSDEDIQFVHRTLDAGDIYYVSNRNNRPATITAQFRVSGKRPEIWRADTGRAEPVAYRIVNGVTEVPLEFAAEESFFVVFLDDTEEDAQVVPAMEPKVTVPIEGAWSVKFQAGRGAPAEISMQVLASLNQSEDPGVRYFSGISTYATEFHLPADYELGEPLSLDLGQVGDVAEIWLNGSKAGTVWHPPFRLEISALVQAGGNYLEVRVANRWVNRLIGDAQPDAEKIGYTVMPTYSADAPLVTSGLVGPVLLTY